MDCPYCNNKDTKVIDSRESKDKSSIKRRRECFSCNKRFSTIEKVLKLDLDVEKSNGEIEVFNLRKIHNSLLKACEKRPVTLEQIEEILNNIIIDIKNIQGQTLPTAVIGNIVLTNLKKFDEMAFLKYAIIHNNYSSMKDFMNEIESLENFSDIGYKTNINKSD